MLDEVLAVAAVDLDLPQVGMVGGGWSRRVCPAVESWTPAAVTSTARSRPRVSVMMLRLRPTIFLPASMPWFLAGTEVEVLMLCASITQAVGSGLLPSCWRTSSLSRPLSWAKTPSFCHLAK